MLTFNPALGAQLTVDNYADLQRKQSELRRRQTLQELLNSFAESRRSPTFQKLEPLVNYANEFPSGGGSTAAPSRQNKRIGQGASRPPLSVEPQMDQDEMAFNPMGGSREAMQQGLPRNFNEPSRRPGTELNPEQVSQIKQWEQNAADAEMRLRKRDSPLLVALAGTPDAPRNNPQVAPPRRASQEEFAALPPEQPGLTLQQRIRIMGENQAPTSAMLQELADDRRRRASQPAQPGEIEITPGLPSIDSMRLYQRQQFDPMMSPEQQRLKQNRDLTREQFQQNQRQFEQEFGLRQTQETNRVVDGKEDRTLRERLAEKEAEVRKLGFLSDLMRGATVPAEQGEGLLNRLLGGLGVPNSPIQNPRERMERTMLNAQRIASRKAVLGEDREPLNPEEQLRVNQHFSNAIQEGRARGWFSPEAIQSATQKDNSETVPGSKSVMELLEQEEERRRQLNARPRSPIGVAPRDSVWPGRFGGY